METLPPIRSASGLHPWIAMQPDDLMCLATPNTRRAVAGGKEKEGLRKDELLEVATFFLDGWNCGCDVRLQIVIKKRFGGCWSTRWIFTRSPQISIIFRRREMEKSVPHLLAISGYLLFAFRVDVTRRIDRFRISNRMCLLRANIGRNDVHTWRGQRTKLHGKYAINARKFLCASTAREIYRRMTQKFSITN